MIGECDLEPGRVLGSCSCSLGSESFALVDGRSVITPVPPLRTLLADPFPEDGALEPADMTVGATLPLRAAARWAALLRARDGSG